MSVDSLKIDYDEDTHQITIDWDKNDPNWSFLNNMSEEEIQQILITSLEELVDEDESY